MRVLTFSVSIAVATLLLPACGQAPSAQSIPAAPIAVGVATSMGVTTSTEVVTTFTGSGTAGYKDDTGTAAQFYSPMGVAVDPSGNVYVADQINERVRKITSAGIVTTLAGSTPGSQDGTGSNAHFAHPTGVAVDPSGNVYVADQDNNSIRKISLAGTVTTLAGGYEGSKDGTGTAAQFWFPMGVALDRSGNVYVADQNNNKIRKITPAGGCHHSCRWH